MADKDIEIGDLFWDEHHAWTDGSQDLNMVHVVLSRDRNPEDGNDYWKLARFMWCKPVGYCGADLNEFGDDEVLKMTKVGNIADIKAFHQ